MVLLVPISSRLRELLFVRRFEKTALITGPVKLEAYSNVALSGLKGGRDHGRLG